MSIYLPPVAASCRRVVQINHPQKQLLIVTLLRVWTSSHHDALSHFCPLATPSPWQRAHLFLSLPHEQAVNTTDTAHASIPYRSRPCDDDRSQAHQPIAGPPSVLRLGGVSHAKSYASVPVSFAALSSLHVACTSRARSGLATAGEEAVHRRGASLGASEPRLC